MSEHTPGPWTVEDNLYDSLYVTGTLKDEGIEKMVLGYDPENGLSIDNDADKRLMFTAPELLEALEGLLSYTRACEGLLNVTESSQCKTARAAIAKARGSFESPDAKKEVVVGKLMRMEDGATDD